MVNYRTMMNCYDSRRVSRRMRQVLADFLDAGMIDDSGEEIEHRRRNRGSVDVSMKPPSIIVCLVGHKKIETRKGGNRGC